MKVYYEIQMDITHDVMDKQLYQDANDTSDRLGKMTIIEYSNTKKY